MYEHMVQPFREQKHQEKNSNFLDDDWLAVL